jgi:hypothetical protein
MFNKKNETKKLTLKRESLRDLTTGQMQQIVGGAPIPNTSRNPNTAPCCRAR